MLNPLNHFFLIKVCARVQKGDKFLLAQRSKQDNFRPGEWDLPGGKVERSLEARILEQTLKRELKEEVGVAIHDDMMLINNAPLEAKKFRAVNLVFLCQWKEGEAQALEDTDAVKWCSLEELEADKTLPEYIQQEVAILRKHIS